MAELTTEEKVYLLSWAVTHNCEESRRLFEKKFGRSPPPVSTVKYWKQRFIETGSVDGRKRTGRTRSATSDDNKENVIQMVEANDRISTRDIAEQLSISQYSVCKILKEEKYYAYKAESCQLLLEDDADRRMEFTHAILQRYQNDPALIRKIKFSDECVFALSSKFNHKNVHKWATENPHFRIGNPGKTQTLTVWACIGYGGIVSYDVSQHTMNGSRYCEVLNEKVIPHFTSGAGKLWIYQQDGAPCHFAADARAILDEKLPGRWIGRRGPMEWPPRSPDLTPCDFWFWAYLRSKVYEPPGIVFPNLSVLRRRIEEEMGNLPLDMFRRTMNNFIARIHRCRETNGDIFE